MHAAVAMIITLPAGLRQSGASDVTGLVAAEQRLRCGKTIALLARISRQVAVIALGPVLAVAPAKEKIRDPWKELV